MPAPKITSVQVRRGTKPEWEAANPQLLDGEIGFETDTYRLKIGRRNPLGHLIHWNDLRYQAPFSGHDKPLYPQDGDFWINEQEELYFFDGQIWRQLLSINAEGDIIINGGVDMSNGCVKSDLLPCEDAKFDLGSPEKRWNEIHLGDTVSETDFAITVGESTDPENVLGGYYRLQLNGDDIAVRKDFENINTTNLPLYAPTDADGNFLPVPDEYEELYNGDTRNLPPQGNISNQSQYNEWVLASLLKIVGRESDPGQQTQQFWNHSVFEESLTAQNGVVTPIEGNVTNYDAAPAAASYFHKADGSVSDRVPLNQSYWVDVPRLTNSRRR